MIKLSYLFVGNRSEHISPGERNSQNNIYERRPPKFTSKEYENTTTRGRNLKERAKPIGVPPTSMSVAVLSERLSHAFATRRPTFITRYSILYTYNAGIGAYIFRMLKRTYLYVFVCSIRVIYTRPPPPPLLLLLLLLFRCENDESTYAAPPSSLITVRRTCFLFGYSSSVLKRKGI